MNLTRSHTSRHCAIAAALLLVAASVLVARPTPAAASSAEVQITAQITDTFSLTVRTDGKYTYGKRKAGKRYKSPKIALFQVKSTRPWVLTDSSDSLISLAGRGFRREQIVEQDAHPAFNRVNRPGTAEVWVRYVLDLTMPSVRTLPEGTPVVTTMRYTVVQQ